MLDLKKLNRIIPPKLFTPIGDCLAVSIIKTTDETEGGVLLPESAKSAWKTPVALVIAVGPEVKQIKEGDHVLCNPSTKCDKVRHGKETVGNSESCEYLILHEEQVQGVLLKKE